MGSQFKITNLDRVRIQKSIKALRHTNDKNKYIDLEERIKNAEIIDSLKVPNDLVTMNSSILLENTKTGAQHSVTLVYPKHADEENDRISILSPFGMALFGATAGEQEVCVELNGNAETFRVVEILYQPELAGHYLI